METFATEVFKSLAILAKPGKYISIENRPSAVNEPKIRINLIYFAFVIEVFEIKIVFLNFLQR